MRSRLRYAPSSIASLLAVAGGGAIALGAWLPWMSYFAGLFPLRGVIGVNGKLLLAAGALALITGAALALPRFDTLPRTRRAMRRSIAVTGLLVVAAAAWLLLGVRQLTQVRAANAMLAPRPGSGLVVVLLGGALLVLVAACPDDRDGRLGTAGRRPLRTANRPHPSAVSAAAEESIGAV